MTATLSGSLSRTRSVAIASGTLNPEHLMPLNRIGQSLSRHGLVDDSVLGHQRAGSSDCAADPESHVICSHMEVPKGKSLPADLPTAGDK